MHLAVVCLIKVYRFKEGLDVFKEGLDMMPFCANKNELSLTKTYFRLSSCDQIMQDRF